MSLRRPFARLCALVLIAGLFGLLAAACSDETTESPDATTGASSETETALAATTTPSATPSETVPLTTEAYFDNLESIASQDAARGVESTESCETWAGTINFLGLGPAAVSCLVDWQQGVTMTRAELNSLSPPICFSSNP